MLTVLKCARALCFSAATWRVFYRIHDEYDAVATERGDYATTESCSKDLSNVILDLDGVTFACVRIRDDG